MTRKFTALQLQQQNRTNASAGRASSERGDGQLVCRGRGYAAAAEPDDSSTAAAIGGRRDGHRRSHSAAEHSLASRTTTTSSLRSSTCTGGAWVTRATRSRSARLAQSMSIEPLQLHGHSQPALLPATTKPLDATTETGWTPPDPDTGVDSNRGKFAQN